MAMFFAAYSIILILSILITGGLFLLRRHFTKTDRPPEHIHPSVFTFFTALYAFFLGFAIVTLWSAFLTAEANVTREADSLMTAFRLSRDLSHSEPLRQALRDYAQSVVTDEWPAMERDTMSDRTKEHFDNVWHKLHLLKPENKGDNDLYTGITGYLSEASRQRMARAMLLKGNLYPPVWVIIIFGFLTMVFGLYYHHIQQNMVRVIFDFMMLFMVLSCIYFIYDINTPFSGYIVVQPEIFTKIRVAMLALQ
jgi:hypothetical protein